GDVAQHLLQGAHHHWATPDHRRVLGHEETHGHAFDAVILHRLEDAAVARARAAANAHHPRHRRAVYVGIENADALPVGGEGESEVDRRRRFADAALARGDSDNRAHPRDEGAALRRATLAMRVTRCGGALR